MLARVKGTLEIVVTNIKRLISVLGLGVTLRHIQVQELLLKPMLGFLQASDARTMDSESGKEECGGHCWHEPGGIEDWARVLQRGCMSWEEEEDLRVG